MRAACLGLALAVVMPLQPLWSQSLGLSPERDLPRWLAAWSPLGARADLPRSLPGVGTSFPRLLLPEPKGGLFWLAGNPAALGDGLGGSRSDFHAALAQQDGDYRRPLDAGESRLLQVDGRSWTQVTPQLFMIGHVVFDRERLEPGTESDFVEAHPTSAFVTTDSSVEALARTRVRLEGAAGWRLGRWRTGASLGYESRETHTIEAGLVRRGRQTTPGMVLGVLRELGPVTLGLHGRWRNRAETALLNEVAREGIVGELEGLGDVRPIPFQQLYYKRREETVTALGAGASWRWAGAAWAIFGELSRLREHLWIQQANQPPKDRWDADAWSSGLRIVSSGAGWLSLAGELRYTSLTGEADLARDTLGVFFTADESLLTAELEARLAPVNSGWTAVLVLAEERQARVRQDVRNGVFWDMEAWVPGVSVEIGRGLGSRGLLLLGGALGRYGPTSAIPTTSSRSVLFRRLVAPELDLTSRNSMPRSGLAGLRYRVSGQTSLWWLGRLESLEPDEPIGPLPAFSPTGSRSSWSLVMGVTLLPADRNPVARASPSR